MNDNQKTILLVEDEAIIAMMEKMELEKYGYTVHHVTTGEKAVHTILQEQSSIDLILMDIDLGPGIDGTQAAEQILSQIDIPIVFLSSHTESEVVEKTEKISSYGYVVKNSGIVVLNTSIKMAFKLFEANKKLRNELMERRRAERAYQESEEKYRAAFTTSPDSININRMDGLYVDINNGFTDLTGYTREDVIGKLSSEIAIWSIPEDREKLVKGLKEHGEVENLESVFTCKDGSFKTALMSARVVTINDEPHILSVTRDITHRKQAEMKLQAEKEILRITLNSIGDAVISTDNQGRVVRMNSVAEMLCGWDESDAWGKKLEEVFNIVNANTRNPVDTPVESVMQTGAVVGLANHTLLLSNNGNEYQIADSAAPIITADGDITGVVLVFRDVTEQYAKDRQLEERLKELNCLYEISGIVEKPNIALKDIIQKTLEVLPQSWQYPESCEAQITLNGQTFQTANFSLTKWSQKSDLIVNGIVSGELTICYREEQPASYEGPFLKEERKLLDTVADQLGRIIERKQLEENLHSIKWMLSGKKENKKGYRPEYGDLTGLNENGLILSSVGKDQLMQISLEYLELLETSSAIYEKNGDYALGLFSSGWCQLLDAASYKLCKTDSNKEALNCGKWLCHDSCWRDASLKTIESGKPVDVPCAGGLRLYAIPVRANGEVIGAINFGYGNPPEDDMKLQEISDQYQIPIEVLREKRDEYQTRPQFIIDYAKKRIEHSAKFIGNLVEGKRAEKEQHESLQRLEFALQGGRLGIWDWNPQDGTVVYSDLWAQILEYHPDEVEPTVDFFKKHIHPEDQEAVLDRLTGHVEGRLPVYKSEHRIRTKTGRWLWVLDLGKIAERDSKGHPIRVTGIISDITERKQAEEEIKKQLSEKVMLLREVHHRVKNNIGYIESFLLLQNDSIANPEAKEAISTAVSRVRSMRVLYDKLLVSNDLREISIKNYIEDLMNSLQNIFVDKGNIKIEKHITDFSIHSKEAIAIGITINELLTNVFKYAFKGRDTGTVSVSIEKKDKMVTIIIQDNGVGIDEKILETKSSGFGLTIVNMLVEQLNGTYSIANVNGTRSIIQFEL